jgi:outer membrane protein
MTTRTRISSVALTMCVCVGSRVLAQAQSGPPPLTLQAAIAIAEEQGGAAKAARSQLEAARWRDRAFDRALLPQVSFGGDAAQFVHQINGVLQPDGSTEFVGQSQNESTFGLTLSQQVPLTGATIQVTSGLSRVDLFGNQNSKYYQTTPLLISIQQGLFMPRTIKWQEREQDLTASIAERAYLEARETVAGQAASAFFDLYAAQLALKNAQTNTEVNATLDTLNIGRYGVGKIAENDLLQSHLALDRAKFALSGALLDRLRAEAALKRLLNMRPSDPIAIVPPDTIPHFEIDPELAVAEALRNQSAIQVMELESVEADQQIGAAKYAAGFGASINASVGFNQTAPQFGLAYQSPLPAQTLQVGINMPVLQWGVGKANTEAARAQAAYTATSSRVEREALEETARFSALQLTQSMAALSIAAEGDTVGQKRFDVAKSRYLIGKIAIGDLYIAQSEKDDAVVAYVGALRAFWTDYYQLRLVTLYDFAQNRRIEDSHEP